MAREVVRTLVKLSWLTSDAIALLAIFLGQPKRNTAAKLGSTLLRAILLRLLRERE